MRRKQTLSLILFGVAPLLVVINCGGKPKVQFAAVLPLSGPAQVYGESIQRGIELAFEDLTQDPTLPYRISLEIEDSASDPDQAASLVAQLYPASLAAIGGVTSDEALAMVASADSADKVLLSPSASSPKLSGISKNFYRIFPNSMDEAVAMINFVKETLHLDQLIVVVEEGAYGEGLAQAVVEIFPGQIESTLSFSGTNNLQQIAKQVVALKSNAVYLAADGVELAQLMKALRAAGFNGENDWILASSALANPRVVELAQGAAERCFLTQTVFDTTSKDEPMASFADHFQTKYGVMPDFFAAHGYDSLLVLVEALKEGGGTLSSDFKKGMRAINNFPGVTGNLQFRESGDVQKFMRVFYIAGGQLQDFVQLMEDRRKALEDKRIEIERRRRELMRNS